MSISPTTDTPRATLVLALGNPLMGDDGLGAAVLARLREAWEWASDVELVDGETWGLRLLPLVEDAGRLLLIDAIDVGAAPGTMVSLEGPELPRVLRGKTSSHEVDLGDVLALAELRGAMPPTLRALGAQPACVAFGAPLSEALAGIVSPLAEAARLQLADWGHAARAREARVRA